MKKAILIFCLCTILFTGCGKVDEVSQKVMDDIIKIETVELDDKELIEKIENTYLTLTEKQKEQVNNYADLLKARDKLDELIKNDELEQKQKKEEEEKTAAEKAKMEEEKLKESYTPEVKYCAKAVITLRNSLKNPDSLKIISMAYSDTSNIKYVHFDISAQNGFGGSTRGCYIVTDSSELVSGIYPDLNTFMYCVEDSVSTADLVALLDESDGVDINVVEQLVSDYDKDNDKSLLD